MKPGLESGPSNTDSDVPDGALAAMLHAALASISSLALFQISGCPGMFLRE